MSNFTNIPIENTFRTTLTQELTSDSTSLILYCAAVPVATLSGQKVRVTINARKGFTYQEDVLVTSIDTVNKTMTCASSSDRGLARYVGDVAGRKSHKVLSEVIISDPYGLWLELQTAINSKMDKSGGTFTGEIAFSGTTIAGLNLNSLTTTQRDALTAANGMVIYNSSTGEANIYQAGAWQPLSSGSTQPNASTTVAGKIEIATAAERAAGTATGGTGAILVPSNDALVKTSSGAGDENKIPILNASGQLALGFLSANIQEADTFFGATNITGAEAETLTDGSNADSLHTHVLGECSIPNQASQTVESNTNTTPVTGSFTFTTTKRAKLISFCLCLIAEEQSGSNTTSVITRKVIFDIINQRMISTTIYSASNQNITSPSMFTSGAANLSDLLFGSVAAVGSPAFSLTDGGNAQITSITSSGTTITFAYSVVGDGTRKAGLALSSVIVLG